MPEPGHSLVAVGAASRSLGLVILAIIGGSNILLMPANSGRLTVEEFAENFNQMARVTDSPLRLHSNGAWVRDSLRGMRPPWKTPFQAA